MTYTIYDGFVLQAKRTLTVLSDIIQKAEEHPNASTFPSSRLYPDMKSLSYQVFSATRQTWLAMARLTNQELPEENSEDDMVYSYAEMYERIENALKFIEGADKDYILEHAEDVKNTRLGPTEVPLAGSAYASIMQANIFFHAMTAYAILRKEGVPLGKRDYIMPFVTIKE